MTNLRTLKRLSAALLAASIITAPVAASAATRFQQRPPSPQKHMLFKVRGPNGATVYLLGSVHLLTPEAGKLPAEVDSAFEHAKVVAFETSIDSLQLRAQEMLTKARYPSGQTLKTSLSPAAVAKADSVVHLYGLSLDMVNGYRPWFVSMALSQMVMQRANYQPQFGVDVQLSERAKTAHKQVIGLESVDFQLNLMDGIQPEDQERMITTAKGPADAAKDLMKIKDAWLTGDLKALEAAFNEADTESPRMMEMMLTRRNVSWMGKIDELLKGKDDALIVFGAGHLVGKMGVLELLRTKGYSIEQL